MKYPLIRLEDYPEALRDERIQRFLEIVLSGFEMTGASLAEMNPDEARLRLDHARQNVLQHLQAFGVDLIGPIDDKAGEFAHISELILQRTYGRILGLLDEAERPDEEPERQA